MKFFIIHGSIGNPNSHWFPWLKDQLIAQGHEAFAPAFPNPPNQSLDNWMKEFAPLLDQVDEETVFIGHSLAPAFILSILEKLNTPIKACYFISGFLGSIGDEEYDPINKTFTEKEFNFDKIKQNCNKFVCFASDNDPYVPFKKMEDFAKELDSEFIVVKGAEHFQDNSGFTSFEQLLKKIKDAQNI